MERDLKKAGNKVIDEIKKTKGKTRRRPVEGERNGEVVRKRSKRADRHTIKLSILYSTLKNKKFQAQNT